MNKNESKELLCDSRKYEQSLKNLIVGLVVFEKIKQTEP